MLDDLTSRVNVGWWECVSQRGVGSWRGVPHSLVPQPGCVQCDGGVCMGGRHILCPGQPGCVGHSRSRYGVRGGWYLICPLILPVGVLLVWQACIWGWGGAYCWHDFHTDVFLWGSLSLQTLQLAVEQPAER